MKIIETNIQNQLKNLIIYLNENWKDEYGGFLELYDINKENPVQIKPTFNSALIFKTNDRL